MGYLIQQNQTARPLLFLLVSSTDHIAGVTGLSPTVTISKNGGSFGAPSGAVSEVGNGWYKVAGNATDANTLGPLVLHATGTGADPTDDTFQVAAFNPDDAVRMGLTALPNNTLMASFWAGLATGTAQAGGATSITLAAGEPATANFYADQAVMIVAGTGAKQVRHVTAYDGTTKVATVGSAWAVNPDNTSVYLMMGRLE